MIEGINVQMFINSTMGKWLPVWAFSLFALQALRMDETVQTELTMQLQFPTLEIWYGLRPMVLSGSERWRSRIRPNLFSIESEGEDSTGLSLLSWSGEETVNVTCIRLLGWTVLKLFLFKVLLMHFLLACSGRSSGLLWRDYKWFDSHEWKPILRLHRASYAQ